LSKQIYGGREEMFLRWKGKRRCVGLIIPFLKGLLLVREDPPPVDRGDGAWDTKLQYLAYVRFWTKLISNY